MIKKKLLYELLVLAIFGIFIFFGDSSAYKQDMPADFITYTDPKNVFRISYPLDWVLALEQMESAKKELGKLFNDVSLEKTVLIFLCGKITDKENPLIPGLKILDPSVNIVVEPSPADISLEKAFQVISTYTATQFESYKVHEKYKIVKEGREAIIYETESQNPGTSLITRSLHMVIIQDNILWLITCATGPEMFNKERETFNKILRSFKLIDNSTTLFESTNYTFNPPNTFFIWIATVLGIMFTVLLIKFLYAKGKQAELTTAKFEIMNILVKKYPYLKWKLNTETELSDDYKKYRNNGGKLSPEAWNKKFINAQKKAIEHAELLAKKKLTKRKTDRFTNESD